MDKLKLAFSIVAKRAKEQRSRGAIPLVLGVRGLLALMYDRIAAYSEDQEGDSEYVLDLAVKAMFAMSECLPELEDDFADDEPQGRHPMDLEDADAMAGEAMAEEDDTRWTKIEPGKTTKDVRK